MDAQSCPAGDYITVYADRSASLSLGAYRLRVDPSRDPATPGWYARLTTETDISLRRDLAMVATPPFRARGPADITLSYGWTPEAVLADSVRRLFFVGDSVDYDTAFALLDFLLWPGTHASDSVVRARVRYEAFPRGTVQLTLRNGKIGRDPQGRPMLQQLDVHATICTAPPHRPQ